MAVGWLERRWWHDASHRLCHANENHAQKTYAPYFILGFLSVTYLNLPILAIALGALSIALIDYFNTTRSAAAEETDNHNSPNNHSASKEAKDGI